MDETNYQTMLRDWQDAKDTFRGDRRQDEPRQVAAWQEVFAAMKTEMDTIWAAGQWFSGPSSLLAVIGRARHETCHSAILAWLLDPGAPHGLFTTLLEAMLRRLWPETTLDPMALRGATTSTEVAKEGCRADIVIWAAGLTIVVEVKVDAGERGDQCNDYYRVFSPEANDVRFAFLTPDGRKPDSATDEDAAKAFRHWSFRQIREDLTARLNSPSGQASRAPGLPAVHTYLQTLEVEFP